MLLRGPAFFSKTINFLLFWNLSISQALEEDKFDEKIDGVADPCTDASLFWGDQVSSYSFFFNCFSVVVSICIFETGSEFFICRH